MTLPLLRPLVLAAVALALAVPAVAGATAAELTTDRGIVQSIGGGAIVLRELDGTTASLAIGPQTRVRVNGVPAALADVLPGFVATVVHKGDAPARVIRAFGKRPAVTDRGTVTGLAKGAITLRTTAGGSVTVALGPATRFRFLGFAVKRAAARPGAIVAVTHPTDGVATLVKVLKRARA